MAHALLLVIRHINGGRAEDQQGRRKKEIPYFEAVAYSASHAGLESADVELYEFIAYLKKQPEFKFEWVQEVYRNTEKLLSEDKRPLLNDWEQDTKKALKL